MEQLLMHQLLADLVGLAQILVLPALPPVPFGHPLLGQTQGPVLLPPAAPCAGQLVLVLVLVLPAVPFASQIVPVLPSAGQLVLVLFHLLVPPAVPSAGQLMLVLVVPVVPPADQLQLVPC
jgi:hypothetical protein